MAHAFELGLVVAQPDDFIEAARLKASWRSSSADAFAATLAHNENAVLVTGEPEFKELGDVVTLEWTCSSKCAPF